MRYFTITEFDSPDEVGSGRLMNIDFLEKKIKIMKKFKNCNQVQLVKLAQIL